MLCYANPKSKPFTIEYHWREFCYRLFYLLCSTVITFTLCFNLSSQLIYLFVRPFLGLNREFIFTDLTEAFYITLSVCSQITLMSIVFFAIYQFCCFFLPSCYFHERKKVVFFINCFCATLLTTFCVVYFFFLPTFCHFLVNYSIKSTSFTVELQAKIESYITLFSRVFISFTMILFLLFLLYSWFSYLAFYKVKFFKKVCDKRPQICLILLIFAATLSPPDPWSQSIIAFSLFIFFEFIIWLAFLNREVQNQRTNSCFLA
jgi:sec-independent protein translocase protein TatC